MAAPIRLCSAVLVVSKNSLSASAHYYPISCNGARRFTGKGIPPLPKCDKYDKDGFRIYRIPGLHRDKREDTKTLHAKPFRAPPREKSMTVDQDWTNVWPTAATFKPSVVPLPLRQGYIKNAGENGGITPDKYGNLELMKVVNFLHLTPRHIRKHCAAIKKFCTPWPQELNNEQAEREHFPVSITTQDYVYAHSTIRDPRSRNVTMKFKLSDLDLDYHAWDKMIRLLGERFNKETDEVTLTSDRCPIRAQNTDYIQYLLTALYYESWKVESWESEKTWADLECYVWDKSEAKERIESLVERLPHADEEQWKKEHVGKVAEAVTKLHNEGESVVTLNEYKKAVLAMFNVNANDTTLHNDCTQT